MTKVVVETRHKDYYEAGVYVGHGFETVRELRLYPTCGKSTDKSYWIDSHKPE